MMIITGGITVKDGCVDQALALSQKHVEHSRSEQGCISHGVYRDHENPSRLFFYEQWTDKQAIEAHFAQASSQAFVAAIRALAVDAPELEMFFANKIN
jgi:quinol monooxygenase YgiN